MAEPTFLSKIVAIVWGLPLVILVMGGGIVLFAISRGISIQGFVHAFRLLTGRFRHHGDEAAPGQISHFQALSNALAATIGLGNIAGVAVAITQGGPGAIFWMWLAGLVGMNTKFFECSLSVMYRGRDYRGQVQGGPMYVIESTLGSRFKFMAIFFAVCGLLGTTALFQTNQLASFLHTFYFERAFGEGAVGDWGFLGNFSWDKFLVGIVMAALVAYVLMGGIKRLAQWTSTIVPFMCLFYVLSCLVILSAHIEAIPRVFMLIFEKAFTGDAALGGAEGLGVIAILNIGVRRAAFSNEAGMGTAPMAHSNVKTSEPICEGFVAMLGPFFDTIIVCTMTALTILVSLDPSDYADKEGILLTTLAFQRQFGDVGVHLLGLAILLFSLSTMIGMANYNGKCWHYLFKGRGIFGQRFFILYFCLTLIFGAISFQDDVINLLDIGFALMALPNMIITLLFASRVKKALKKYTSTYLTNSRPLKNN